MPFPNNFISSRKGLLVNLRTINLLFEITYSYHHYSLSLTLLSLFQRFQSIKHSGSSFYTYNIHIRSKQMLILLSEFQLKRRLTTILVFRDRYKYILRHLCRTKIHLDRHIFLSDHFSKAMHPKMKNLELLKQNYMQRR